MRWWTAILAIVLQLGSGPDLYAEANVDRGRNVALGSAAAVAPRAACHTCHGEHGAGDASGAFPRLTGQAAWYLYKQLRDYASGERVNEVMGPIAKLLSDQQMQDVAAYFAAQAADKPATARSDDPMLVQRGGAISAMGLPDSGVAACVNCHGASGAGLPPSFPYLAGQFAPYVELQLRWWREGKRRNDPLGVMEQIASRLSGEDVRALAAYFASLPPPAPKQQASSAQ